jgi:membrane-associated protease RseP (regulator of RpoE activity)
MRGRGWLQAVGVLAGTVLVHELAHAVAARRVGGEVRELSLGFGPPLARRRVAGVDVTLRPFPLGGFAAVDIERLPPARRIPVLLAGPLANVTAGLVLRALAGRAAPTVLPGQTRPVEMGGMLAALAMLTRASAQGPASLARAAGDVNLSVGLANLIPAVPLDGGHLAAAQLEAAGAGRGLVAVFRQVSAAVFLSFALWVLLADVARLRAASRAPGRRPA